MFFGLPLAEYAPLGQRAEQLGFEALWLADHLITPVHFTHNYPYAPTGDPGYRSDTPLTDVWVTIGHLAAVTRRILLATGLYILPLRPPFVSARAVATAQQLSNGRVLFGAAIGWQREEFEVSGAHFGHRGAQMDEILEILRALWTGKPITHEGEWYRFAAVQMAPAIVPPPLILGGTTDHALRRAARTGQGWYGPNSPLEETIACRDRLEHYRAECGTQSQPFTYYVRLFGGTSPDNIAHYAANGFEHFVVGLSQQAGYHQQLPLCEKMERLDALAAAVLP
jgi:probable F420-dependent oxidoreductase